MAQPPVKSQDVKTPSQEVKVAKDEDDRLLEEMLAEDELQWTDVKPKAEGFYWTKYGAEKIVVRVEKQPLNRGLKVVLPAHEVRSFDMTDFKWWKGPLETDDPPPTEYVEKKLGGRGNRGG